MKRAADFGQSLYREIMPFEAMIRAEGGTPESAVRTLFNTAYLLRTANPAQKQQLFVNLAQQYGVDLQGLAQGQPQVDPVMQPIVSRMQALERELQESKWQQQQQLQAHDHRENAAANAEVEAFRANPDNLYLDNVREHMAHLLETGYAKDLQDAYDKACWAHPEIRAQLQAKQAQEAEQKRQAEAKAKAAQARKAAGINVQSSPSTVTAAGAKKGLFEDLSDIYDAHNA